LFLPAGRRGDPRSGGRDGPLPAWGMDGQLEPTRRRRPDVGPDVVAGGADGASYSGVAANARCDAGAIRKSPGTNSIAQSGFSGEGFSGVGCNGVASGRVSVRGAGTCGAADGGLAEVGQRAAKEWPNQTVPSNRRLGGLRKPVNRADFSLAANSR